MHKKFNLFRSMNIRNAFEKSFHLWSVYAILLLCEVLQNDFSFRFWSKSHKKLRGKRIFFAMHSIFVYRCVKRSSKVIFIAFGFQFVLPSEFICSHLDPVSDDTPNNYCSHDFLNYLSANVP
jgi:hypothetical protein